MKEDLEKYRKKIDEADKNLMLTLQQRFEAVANISAIKKSSKLPSIDIVRENQKNLSLLSYYKSLSKNNYSFEFYLNIFRQIIVSSILNHNKEIKLVVDNSLNGHNHLKSIFEFFGFEIKMNFKDSTEISKLDHKNDTLLVLDYNSPLWSDNKITDIFQVFIELPLCNKTSINKMLVAKNNFDEIAIFDHLYLVNTNNNKGLPAINKVAKKEFQQKINQKIIGGSFAIQST